MSGGRCAGVLIVLACCLVASPVHALDGGRYGNVKVIEPAVQARGFVIFFTDRKGLNPANDAAAADIAKAGGLVVEVNTPAYLKRLDALNEKCHQLVGDAEWLSRQLQRARNFPRYLTPILAGTGEGGTLAGLALAQAPAVTIAGAVAVDPSSSIASRIPICSTAPVQSRPQGFTYGPVKSLQGFWSVDLTPNASKADRDYIRALQRAGAPVEIHEISRKLPTVEALRSLIAPHLTAPAPASNVSQLPLYELPVQHSSKLMAVVLSGDGGWRDLDKTIAEDLQAHGVPAVGWDTLRYFWSKKTPEQTSADLAAVIETYMAKWHANEVALIGYSFGADVMPFAYNRLPESVRSHVVLISLLGLAKSADFEIRITGWLGLPAGPQALPVLREAEKIAPGLMQCFYGEKEDDTACPELAKHGVQAFRTAGGHHFNGNYEPLERDILAGLQRRAGPLPLLEASAHSRAASHRWLAKDLGSTSLMLAALVSILTLMLLALAGYRHRLHR
jgi:type IV secretory pathway VirJ component